MLQSFITRDSPSDRSTIILGKNKRCDTDGCGSVELPLSVQDDVTKKSKVSTSEVRRSTNCGVASNSELLVDSSELPCFKVQISSVDLPKPTLSSSLNVDVICKNIQIIFQAENLNDVDIKSLLVNFSNDELDLLSEVIFIDSTNGLKADNSSRVEEYLYLCVNNIKEKFFKDYHLQALFDNLDIDSFTLQQIINIKHDLKTLPTWINVSEALVNSVDIILSKGGYITSEDYLSILESQFYNQVCNHLFVFLQSYDCTVGSSDYNALIKFIDSSIISLLSLEQFIVFYETIKEYPYKESLNELLLMQFLNEFVCTIQANKESNANTFCKIDLDIKNYLKSSIKYVEKEIKYKRQELTQIKKLQNVFFGSIIPDDIQLKNFEKIIFNMPALLQLTDEEITEQFNKKTSSFYTDFKMLLEFRIENLVSKSNYSYQVSYNPTLTKDQFSVNYTQVIKLYRPIIQLISDYYSFELYSKNHILDLDNLNFYIVNFDPFLFSSLFPHESTALDNLQFLKNLIQYYS